MRCLRLPVRESDAREARATRAKMPVRVGECSRARAAREARCEAGLNRDPNSGDAFASAARTAAPCFAVGLPLSCRLPARWHTTLQARDAARLVWLPPFRYAMPVERGEDVFSFACHGCCGRCMIAWGLAMRRVHEGCNEGGGNTR